MHIKKEFHVHVWVDETRPRNQGANLTSYELNEEEVYQTQLLQIILEEY